MYEVSCARLNHDKTEGVWFGWEHKRLNINIQIKTTIKTLGIHLNNKDSYRGKKWDNKEK